MSVLANFILMTIVKKEAAKNVGTVKTDEINKNVKNNKNEEKGEN